MKKKLLFGILLIVLSAFNALNADVDIYKIFKGLTNTFDSLSAKNGLLAELDEALLNASKFKAFSSCQVRALSSDKPYKMLVQVIKKPGKPDIKISCGDYAIPLEAIKFMVEVIKNKIIGSADNPGLFSSIIEILEGAGIEEIEEVKALLKEIHIILKAFEDILSWLVKSLKVDPNAKATINIPEPAETDRNEPQNPDEAKTAKDQKNFYEILEISTTATITEVKRAYRKLALQYHPDKNTEDPTAEEKFKMIAEAYATLSDPATRKAYDVAMKNAK